MIMGINFAFLVLHFKLPQHSFSIRENAKMHFANAPTLDYLFPHTLIFPLHKFNHANCFLLDHCVPGCGRATLRILMLKMPYMDTFQQFLGFFFIDLTIEQSQYLCVKHSIKSDRILYHGPAETLQCILTNSTYHLSSYFTVKT